MDKKEAKKKYGKLKSLLITHTRKFEKFKRLKEFSKR